MKYLQIIIILFSSFFIYSCDKKEEILYTSWFSRPVVWSIPQKIHWSEKGDEKIDGKYVGEIENNKPNGQGTVNLPDGRKYEGNFRKGEMHGQGTFTFPDGRKFSGEFLYHKLWEITYYDKDGKIIRKWSKGKKVF